MLNSDSVLSANERVIAAIIAVIIHIFFGIFLFFPIWERPIPAPEPAGITMISFGNVTTVTEIPAPNESEFKPSITENDSEVETEEVITETIEEVKEVVTPKVETQEPNIETTKNDNKVSVTETKENKKTEKKVDTPTKKEEQKPKEEKKIVEETKQEKESSKPETTTNKNSESNNTTNSNEKGEKQTKDKQGNSDDPADKGKVGVEGGAEVEISGWRWITKPKPNDVLNEQGTIAFSITIDKDGNVTQASLKSKSSTIGISTYSAYKAAILKTKFERTVSTPITGPSFGTITFYIKVGN
ncbi:hypothetical protein [Bernardetia sp.]|uniref:hypothetical protein n=1 Tax=Bernardetia sp. TaxID=1937974 RepID=UPI0025C0DD5D|nr:hypothetical protein [Bernardetia sp.]